MKNTYIAVVILIIIILGAVFIFTRGKKAEAPMVDTQTETDMNMQTQTEPENQAEVKVQIGNTALVKEFTVKGQNFSFTPNTITVKKGDKVKITFENVSGMHDFRIDEYGLATKKSQSPATEVLEFTADKAGSFEYYCSVGSHRAMGMKGTLIVQ